MRTYTDYEAKIALQARTHTFLEFQMPLKLRKIPRKLHLHRDGSH